MYIKCLQHSCGSREYYSLKFCNLRIKSPLFGDISGDKAIGFFTLALLSIPKPVAYPPLLMCTESQPVTVLNTETWSWSPRQTTDALWYLLSFIF